MIRAILFDLDETLIDRTETMRLFLLNQHKLFAELSNHSDHDFASTCLAYQENGYADKMTAYTCACEKLGLLNIGLAERLFEDFKERYGEDPVPFPDATETLSKLSINYLIGLVSNGRTKGQTAKITACGFAPFFSSICISESFGCKKPDPAIFLACLKELSVLPNEAVFVGDNPQLDIEPAKLLGMRAVWVKNDNFSAPVSCDGIITNLRELPSLIERLPSH